MDFKSTIDLIIKDLNEASEIIDDLKKYPGVPVLQVELAKSKCRSAGEVIALLKTISDIIPVKNEPVNENKPVHSEEKTLAQPGNTRIDQQQEEKKKESDPREIPVTPVKKKMESKSHWKEDAEASIIADKFSHVSERYNELAGSIKAEKDLSDQLKAKKVAHLSDAIGISDKFLFMGEIFDGNKDAYTQAITRLDKAESLQDAISIIKSYTGEKPESEAVTQLFDLVKLKFPSNE